MSDLNIDQENEQELVVSEAPIKPKRPPLYKVILLNDDFTPMDFVVDILKRFFGMNEDKATQIMLHIHHRGIGVCGVYSKDVAESKVQIVNDYARHNQHPLLCSMEKS
ncbi:MAG: ATP-dependent Clp protease adapter ClpS [Gammaproteobacteria bacterium]|nr:ATP-dependent Clp protease adapter ClpS [Gammaproteobacteria bacterium]